MFFSVFLSHIYLNLLLYTQTHKPDQTKININEFDMAKSAAQLLYDPVLVCPPDGGGGRTEP